MPAGIEGFRVKSIVVVRLRFIGDVLLSTAALRVLKRAFPQASLTYVTEAGPSEAIRGNPHVDHVVLWPQEGSIASRWQVLRRIREDHPDVVIDWFGNPSSALISWWSKAAVRIGFDHRGRRWAYTHLVSMHAKTALDVYAQPLECLGIRRDGSSDLHETEFLMNEAGRHAAEDVCGGLGQGPLIGVFPGASWPAKRWPEERFVQLVRRVLTRWRGVSVIVLEGPRERGLAKSIVERVGTAGIGADRVRMAGSLPLDVVGAVLRRCVALITNDAAPMHLGAAVKIPVVALFGPGDPSVWFPYPDPCKALHKAVPCCHQDVCRWNHECMNAITVEDVMEALQPLVPLPV